MKDLIVALGEKIHKDTLYKVLDRLIKNERWHCKIIVSLILQLQNEPQAEAKPPVSHKDQAMALVKKILKSKPWDLYERGKKMSADDWNCIYKGLLIYFGSYESKDLYRLFKEYIPSNLRHRMEEENTKIADLVKAFSKR